VVDCVKLFSDSFISIGKVEDTATKVEECFGKVSLNAASKF
jgi:hypothetical protein